MVSEDYLNDETFKIITLLKQRYNIHHWIAAADDDDLSGKSYIIPWLGDYRNLSFGIHLNKINKDF